MTGEMVTGKDHPSNRSALRVSIIYRLNACMQVSIEEHGLRRRKSTSVPSLKCPCFPVVFITLLFSFLSVTWMIKLQTALSLVCSHDFLQVLFS
uniref:Uncharacterized protein n=1 Tax=Scophthalmus maximus TaxID=52904 RepID=A0A8D3BJL9_SCOMX